MATSLLLTQAGAEVWGANSVPPLRVTQAGGEVWLTNPAPPLRVAQAGAEVWLALNTPYVANAATPSISVIT